MLNNFVEKIETLFRPLKKNFFTVPNILFLLLVKKCQFSLQLLSVKTGLEIRSNDVLDRTETFLD